MNNKVVAYIRRSTNNQSDNSPTIQREAIEQYVKVNGLDIKWTYKDIAYSGTTSERPAFKEMLEAAKNNPTWSTILVYDYSRFSRERDAMKYIKELEGYGISVVSIKEPFEDYRNAIFEKSNQYVRKVSHATRDALEQLAKDGKHCGGTPPLGYDVSLDKKLIINEAEAVFVRQIFEMFTQGYSYEEIYDKLKQDGVKNRRGEEFKKRSLKGILQNKKYIGESTWCPSSKNEEEVKEKTAITSTCPAIIDKAVFNKAQELIKSRAGGNGTKSRNSRTLFSDSTRIICGECGAVLKVKQRSQSGKNYCLYYCPNHVKEECKQKEIRARDVDRFTAVCITNLIFKQKNITKIDKLDRKELKRMIVEHLTKKTNSHVRDLIEALDVHVTIDSNDINIDIMSEST